MVPEEEKGVVPMTITKATAVKGAIMTMTGEDRHGMEITMEGETIEQAEVWLSLRRPYQVGLGMMKCRFVRY